MTYSDQQLSAFLDSELDEHEMAALREALAMDEALADRLAELALVDTVVASAYATIDHRPVPEAVTTLLSPATGADNVVALPVWQRLRRSLQPQYAIAASLALLAVFGIARLIPDASQTDWQNVAAVLETAPSGISHPLDADTAIKPRLTYKNRDGDYCRQFQLARSNGTEESIACRKDDQWQRVTTVYLPAVNDDAEYSAASGGSGLDAILDQSIADGPFDAQTEESLISSDWSAVSDSTNP
ncbi:MAG: hypothetical protein VR73_04315 [Gammaproteobacteria bacterium BRH_c0]|nr:MAG: hypothetical protein VR73_04315 [Gammaproteobacteria bacterium BRH_c0]